MPEAVKIVIIVVAACFLFYLLLLVMNLIFYSFFKHSLQKHEKGFAIILAAKLEDIKFMFKAIKKAGIDVDNRYYEILNDINIQDLVGQSRPECAKARETLTYLKEEGLKIAAMHPELKDNPDFVQAKRNIVDQDKIYRKYMAIYNADIIGYNYWIRFLPWRFLWLLLKVKTKDII